MALDPSTQSVGPIGVTDDESLGFDLFDVATIPDDAIRERYERALRRGRAMSAAMTRDFPDRRPVRMLITEEQAFNAHAGADDLGYRLELAKPVPLFLLILFERLLSDPRLLPWLDVEGEKVSDYQTPFVFDPAHFGVRELWSIQLTDIRSFAAGMLADLTLAFMQMHELGHVMCGHVEGYHAATGRRAMAELSMASDDVGTAQLEREQAWEADADSVAASLLVQYLRELVTVADEHPKAQDVFGRGEETVEHVLSLAVVALYALFAYLRGARYALGRRSSHPHPFVRANYVKDMTMTVARREWAVNLDRFAELMNERLDEMLVALGEADLSDNAVFDDTYIDAAEREGEALMRLRRKHRKSCLAWSWFSWTNADTI